MANAPERTPQRAGGLLGRLFGIQESEETTPPEETTPQLEENGGPAIELPEMEETSPPVAERVEIAPSEITSPPALEIPVVEARPAMPKLSLEEDLLEVEIPTAPREQLAPVRETSPPLAEIAPSKPAVQYCPACGAMRQGTSEFCSDCGWMFASSVGAASASSASSPSATAISGGVSMHTPPVYPLKERFQVGSLVGQRGGVYRYQGIDLQGPSGKPRPVMIIVGAVSAAAPMAIEAVAEPLDDENNFDDFIPTFDEPLAVAEVTTEGATWPSVGWEKNVLDKANHPSLPKALDHFVDGDFEYLIEEVPQGRLLWDAWDDPDNTVSMRYGLLIQLAEGLQGLHKGNAILEGFRPDLVVVTDSGQAVISDLTDLLPIPLPPDAPIKGTLYTAPELIVEPSTADARADMYSFGATIYSLEYLHHPLEEKDFERQFYPHMITDRYPDVHPAFNRLVMKTFCRDLHLRFPTDEAAKTDSTGFSELINTLKVCQRTFARSRLDIAAWTTTGIVRTGNEDAFALLHAVESRQDDLYEYALILLADGMGGYEAGEVAAAMCIQSLRSYLLEQPLFAALAGKVAPEDTEFNVEAYKKVLLEALKHANTTVYTASRTPGKGRRGMGCTAEVVYVDDRHIVVGHVGDSRTYHLTNGEIRQLTRDQTLVNRLVELGQLTEEEAEHHDRKNELQQAIGGQPNVTPGIYSADLTRGDWVLVCSDGLTNHVPNKDLEKMLLRETNTSSEEAARRLVNLVNLRGATDNSTVVLIRAS